MKKNLKSDGVNTSIIISQKEAQTIAGFDEDGNFAEASINFNALAQDFQINGVDYNTGFNGETQLKFTPFVTNAQSLPIVWAINSIGGDVAGATIDSATGEVTYSLVQEFSNNGRGFILISATDAAGKNVQETFEIEANGSSSVVTLACNANLDNTPTIKNKMIFNGQISPDYVYVDVAKTTLANDGEIVENWVNSTGSGDVFVRSGNIGPTYIAGGGPNGNDILRFSGQDTSLQYDVPNTPPAGSPFKLFFLVKTDPSLPHGPNAAVISSTLAGANDVTSDGTWQVARNGGDKFVFRSSYNATGHTMIFGENTDGVTSGPTNQGDIILSEWAEFNNGEYHLIYIDSDGSNIKGYFDGVKKFEFICGGPLVAEHFKFGENRAGGDHMAIDLAELQFADASLTESEATQVQAYYLCKYGLDASLISDPGPFSVNVKDFFGQFSQFELHTYPDASQKVYDVRNNQYYDIDNVPTPDLGMYADPKIKELLARIEDANISGPWYDEATREVAKLGAEGIYLPGDRPSMFLKGVPDYEEAGCRWHMGGLDGCYFDTSGGPLPDGSVDSAWFIFRNNWNGDTQSRNEVARFDEDGRTRFAPYNGTRFTETAPTAILSHTSDGYLTSLDLANVPTYSANTSKSGTVRRGFTTLMQSDQNQIHSSDILSVYDITTNNNTGDVQRGSIGYDRLEVEMSPLGSESEWWYGYFDGEGDTLFRFRLNNNHNHAVRNTSWESYNSATGQFVADNRFSGIGGGVTTRTFFRVPRPATVSSATNVLRYQKWNVDFATFFSAGSLGQIRSYFNTQSPTSMFDGFRVLGQVDPSEPVSTPNRVHRWSGFIRSPITQPVTFGSTSDDWSFLFVGGDLIVDNGGNHAAKTETGTANVSGAWVPIEAWFGAGNNLNSISFTTNVDIEYKAE